VISIQSVAIGAPGRDLEVLGLVLDDPLGAVVVGDPECLHQCVVDRLKQVLPLLERPPLHDLDPDVRH